MTDDHGKFPNVPEEQLAQYSMRWQIAAGVDPFNLSRKPCCVIERCLQLLPHEKGGPKYNFERTWEEMTIAG